MTTAHLREAELLASLREALFLFETSGRSVMLDARQAIGDTEAWLDGRRGHWAAEAARLRRDLQLCRAAAADGGDCSPIAAALKDAEDELETAERWIGQVARAATTYRANETRFQRVLDHHCSTARAYLGQKQEVVTGFAGGGGAGTGGGTSRTAANAATTAPSLSSYATNGGAFSDVPLGQIEDPSFAPGEFQQADIRDMRQSFAQLPQIQSAIQNGTIGQLTAADPALMRTYTWFYGGEAIKLEWQNGRFAINNGKHRVYLARMLGVSQVPSVIVGRP